MNTTKDTLTKTNKQKSGQLYSFALPNIFFVTSIFICSLYL